VTQQLARDSGPRWAGGADERPPGAVGSREALAALRAGQVDGAVALTMD
jgi:hypothetical protein